MDLMEGATLRASGEGAFVVEFGDTIDADVSRRVARLAAAFDTLSPAGLLEVVPTFRSVLVEFDPDVTCEAALLDILSESDAAEGTLPAPSAWSVPVALSGAAAEDLDEAAAALDISPAQLREIFLAGRYQLGMFGFAPGFAYLSGVDKRLAVPRRPAPRPPMPAGSVIIAGGMAALAPQPMPTGWYVIGRTPAPLFRIDRKPMTPFAVGDTITFRLIDPGAFEDLAAREDGGLEKQ